MYMYTYTSTNVYVKIFYGTLYCDMHWTFLFPVLCTLLLWYMYCVLEKVCYGYLCIYINITRSEARFASLLLDCELSYCFHWVIVVVGGRVHEWCKKGSGIKGHIIIVTSVYVARTCMWWWCACPRP